MLLSNVENWFPLLKRQLGTSFHGFLIELHMYAMNGLTKTANRPKFDVMTYVGW
jgi:hypothetical protein